MTDPTADQIDAARRHTRDVLRAVGAITGRPRRPGPAVDSTVGARITEWLAAMRTAWDTGTADVCTHAARTPQPMMAMLAIPAAAVCARCGPKLIPRYERTVPADRCDSCLRIVPPGGGFHELTIDAAPLMLCANVCARCHDQMTLAAR